MAVLRDWINPLNRVGLKGDIDEAWFLVSDHEPALEVDDRIDRALKHLRELGQTLRQSFNLLHVKQLEEHRERNEALQRRVEIGAAAFLIPTLIVGFYGANTWVPGESEHWGFWVMVVALIIFSLGGVAVVMYWHREQRRREQESEEELQRLRSQLIRGIRPPQ